MKLLSFLLKSFCCLTLISIRVSLEIKISSSSNIQLNLYPKTEAHVESDEEVPEDDFYVAKASSKKERKRQEREAQRQVS